MKVGFIGLGNMGRAIYDSVQNDFELLAFDPFKALLDKSISYQPTVQTLIESSEVIIICTKPDKVVETLKLFIDKPKVILSIAAGVQWTTLKENSHPQSTVVRLMPNLPLIIGQGCTGYYGDKQAYEIVQKIFQKTGIIVELTSETLMDAITGLSGSGPAYVASFVQALAEGGVKSGISYMDSLRIAIQTIKGSCQLIENELAHNPNYHPYQLRNQVASPGGTTIFGLDKLEENGFTYAVVNGVYSAFLKGRELGKK